jgi:hypothetical protein
MSQTFAGIFKRPDEKSWGREAKVSRKIQRLSAWIHRDGLYVHVEFGWYKLQRITSQFQTSVCSCAR